MEILKKEFTYPSRKTKYQLFPLGDLHAGSVNCDEDRFQNKVNEIKNNPHALWIGMGDMADCITQNDKRFDTTGLATWVQRDNIVESQRSWLKELLRPIAGKCLCYLTGNHEEKIHQFHQNDISHNICNDLGLPYGGYSAFIALIFKRAKCDGSHQVTVHARHGAGGAQSEGAVVLNLMRLVNAFTADIYLSGHLHKLATYCPERLELDRGFRIRQKRLIATLTGSWLKAYQQGEHISYAEAKGYKPTQLGCPMIEIRPETKEFSVVL